MMNVVIIIIYTILRIKRTLEQNNVDANFSAIYAYDTSLYNAQRNTSSTDGPL